MSSEPDTPVERETIQVRFDLTLFDELHLSGLTLWYLLPALLVVFGLAFLPAEMLSTDLVWSARFSIPLIFVFMFLGIRRKWRKLSKDQKAITWQIGPDEIELRDNEWSSVKFPWNALGSVAETGARPAPEPATPPARGR